MKKILYIDYLTNGGHVVFNRIQLKSLISLGNVSVDIVMRDSCESYSDLSVSPLFTLSPKLYVNSPLGYRISLIIVQFYLYSKIKFEKYDYVIFSSYDALTFWLMPHLKTKVYLFNHNNIARYENKFELCCAKLISKDYVHLALNKYIQQRLKGIGINNVQIVLHGFIQEKKELTLQNSMIIDEQHYSKILFCPSQTSSDEEFLQTLISDQKFQQYLITNRILLIIKGNYSKTNCLNIKIINTWLSKKEYDFIFMKSDLVLLLYKESFKYRVSGVLFECIANNKKCLISDTPNFRVYEKYFKYNPYTNHNMSEILSRIHFILSLGFLDYYKDISSLQPDWRLLI